jgi:hypothetical protein
MSFRQITCSKAFLKVILFLSSAWIVSCSTVRKLPEGAALLTKNEISVNGEPSSDPALKSGLRQKANKRALGSFKRQAKKVQALTAGYDLRVSHQLSTIL